MKIFWITNFKIGVKIFSNNNKIFNITNMVVVCCNSFYKLDCILVDLDMYSIDLDLQQLLIYLFYTTSSWHSITHYSLWHCSWLWYSKFIWICWLCWNSSNIIYLYEYLSPSQSTGLITNLLGCGIIFTGGTRFIGTLYLY